MPVDLPRFAVLADAHVQAPEAAPLRGIDSNQNLRAAIAGLQAVRPPVEFVIHLGDAAADGSAAAYDEFRAIVNDVAVPQFGLAGNHDDPARLLDALPPPPDAVPSGAPQGYFSLTRGGLHVVALNSHVDGAVAGRIDAAQLAWLATDLQAAAGRATVVCIHHPPAPVGIDWIDRLRLANDTEFARVIGKAEGVALILAGHIHRPEQRQVAGVPLQTAPSTWAAFGAEPSHRLNEGQGFLVVDGSRGRLDVQIVAL